MSSCSERDPQTFAEAERPDPAESAQPPQVDSSSLPQPSPPASDDAASPPQPLPPAGNEGRAATDTADTRAAPPDCALVDRIVATPSAQSGDAARSTIQLLLVPGVTPSSISWEYSSSSSARGTLFAVDRAQVSFDCETNGSAEIIATVQAIRQGQACSASARTLIECSNQPVPSSNGSCLDASCLPPALGMCGKCTLDYCGAQIAQVNDNLDAVEPILNCVLGKDWPAGERAAATSCGNLDALSCYCGDTSTPVCAATAPDALDGACREPILAGTGCRDSACVQARLFVAGNSTGKAMQYLRCTQDFCYDYCFNP